MDVFKTHVGEGRAIAISRENYFMEAKGMEPYVVERDGHRTFYAVCPECDNPIQLIGLNRRELDAGHRRPYGRHVGHDVPRVAVYDETAYLECSYSNPGYHRDPGSRRPPVQSHGIGLVPDYEGPVRPGGIRLAARFGNTPWHQETAEGVDLMAERQGMAELRFHLLQPAADAVHGIAGTGPVRSMRVQGWSGRCGSFHS